MNGDSLLAGGYLGPWPLLNCSYGCLIYSTYPLCVWFLAIDTFFFSYGIVLRVELLCDDLRILNFNCCWGAALGITDI